MAKSPAYNTRDRLVADMSLVLKSWDKDGDSKLSRAEVHGMVDEFIRRLAKDFSRGQISADLEKQRQDLLGLYASQDIDRDGYLTLYELLKGPFAYFDCMDTNRDGKLEQAELNSKTQQCPSVNLDDYAPKP